MYLLKHLPLLYGCNLQKPFSILKLFYYMFIHLCCVHVCLSSYVEVKGHRTQKVLSQGLNSGQQGWGHPADTSVFDPVTSLQLGCPAHICLQLGHSAFFLHGFLHLPAPLSQALIIIVLISTFLRSRFFRFY